MSKRVLIFTLYFFLLLTFTSCGLFNDESLDPKLKDKVDFISAANNTHYIEYENDLFQPHTEKILSIDKSAEYVFLGWNGSCLGYKNQYYSYQITNPIFIYETRTNCLYLRRDYNFKMDTFILQNTDASITFSDAIISESHLAFEINDVVGVDCILYSKNYPELKMFLHVFQYENMWYISTVQGGLYKISEDFIEILLENEVISA